MLGGVVMFTYSTEGRLLVVMCVGDCFFMVQSRVVGLAIELIRLEVVLRGHALGLYGLVEFLPCATLFLLGLPLGLEFHGLLVRGTSQVAGMELVTGGAFVCKRECR